jgi:hypothetical protein
MPNTHDLLTIYTNYRVARLIRDKHDNGTEIAQILACENVPPEIIAKVLGSYGYLTVHIQQGNLNFLYVSTTQITGEEAIEALKNYKKNIPNVPLPRRI